MPGNIRRTMEGRLGHATWHYFLWALSPSSGISCYWTNLHEYWSRNIEIVIRLV